MSQAATWSVPLTSPATPTEMATRMDDSLNALLSTNAEATAPSYAVAGAQFIEQVSSTEWNWQLYDGTDWNTVLTLNPTTGAIALPVVSVGAASAGGHALNRDTADARYAQLSEAEFTGAVGFLGAVGFDAAVVANSTFRSVGVATFDTNVEMDATRCTITNNSNDLLRLNREGTTGTMQIFQSAGATVGSITQNGTNTAYNTSSDGQLKPERKTFDPWRIIDALRPVLHNWANQPDRWSHGLIAQQVHEVYPEAVAVGHGNPGDPDFVPWSIDYSKFAPVMIAALQTVPRGA
jgi:hypothetical protein